MQILESIINHISPRWASNRARARLEVRGYQRAERVFSAAATSAEGGSAYTAAGKRRSFFGWLTSSADADADLNRALPELRNRSQALYRNSPAGRGVIKRLAVGAIGSGLAMRATVDRNLLGLSEDAARDWNDAAEREFRLWADSRECDYARRLTFAEMQLLAFTSQKLRGDCFALLRWDGGGKSPYDLRVQLIEADRICNPNDALDDDRISGGIERDANGIPTKIHVRNIHPGNPRASGAVTWEPIPIYGTTTGRRQILHLMEHERIDQSRGEPSLAPVIDTLKQLTTYSEAELHAAIVNAAFAIAIKRPLEQDNPETGVRVTYTEEEKRLWQNRGVEIGMGNIIDLAPGQDITSVTAGRPSPQYDIFFSACLKQIGMCVGVPFEVLMQHFQSSYSASRAALLEFVKNMKVARSFMRNNFCQPIYEEFLTEAVSTGRLNAPGFLTDPVIRAGYCRADWMGPSPGQIDPLKEVQATALRIKYRLSTLGREVAEMSGADFEQVAYALQEELNLLEKLDLETDFRSATVVEDKDGKNDEEE